MIYLELFLTFLKIGAFTFGGGYAMLPLIQAEVVSHGWMEQQAIIDFIAVSESTPGPFAVNMATYIGSEIGGIFGSVCATIGVVLPSFVIILIVAKCFEKFKQNKVVKGCMSGLKPAVVGLIASAVITVAATVFVPTGFSLNIFTNLSFYVSLIIFILSLVAALKKVHPIIIISFSAVVGITCGYLL